MAIIDGIDLAALQTEEANDAAAITALQVQLQTLAAHPSTDPDTSAEIVALKQTIAAQATALATDEATIADISAQLHALQASELTQNDVTALVTKLLAATQPPATGGETPPTTGTGDTGDTGSGSTQTGGDTGGGNSGHADFKPAAPTALDIYTDAATLHLDLNGGAAWIGKAFNIISTGAVPTQIQVDNLDWWKEQPDAVDGGDVWAEVHATGTNPTLYFCAAGLTGFNQAPPAPTNGDTDTPPPVTGPTGAADLSSTPVVDAVSPIANDPNIVIIQVGETLLYHNGKQVPALPANGDPTKAVNLGPYSVTGADGKTVFNLPAHWRNAWWADRSKEPLAIIMSPAELAAKNLTFTYGDIGIPIPPQGVTPPYTLMGTSDDVIYEPTTGERAQIGVISDESAEFLLGLDPAGNAMLIYSDVGNTCPNKYLDDVTGQPVDLTKYVTANHYSSVGAQGSPDMSDGPGSQNGNAGPGGFTPQQAHHYNYWYPAQPATGSASLLLQGQYHANFMLIDDAYESGILGKATVFGEQRGVGWGLRELFLAHAATRAYEAAGNKTGPGTPFMTAAYFQTLLDNARAYYDACRTDPKNVLQIFAPSGDTFAPWQQDYCLEALSYGVLTNHPEWVDLYLFALGNAIARANGTSGMPPAWTGYYYQTSATSWNDAFLTGVPGLAGAEPPTADQIAALKADPMNGNVLIGSGDYMMGTRAVLAMAITLDNKGLAPVRKMYPDLDTAYANAHALLKKFGSVNPRQSVVAA